MAEFKQQSDRDENDRPKFRNTNRGLPSEKSLSTKEPSQRRRKSSRVIKQSKFMLVNIAWNHSGWTRLEPNPHIGFGFTKQFNKGALSPHEAHNFDFRKKDIDSNDTVYGYFQTRGVPRRFASGGVIFFWSRSTDDGKGYFIGVYGNAAVLGDVKRWRDLGFETGEFWANIRGDKRHSCLFPCHVHDSAYKTGGKRLIGRANFAYNFDKGKALKLLDEAKNKSCGGDSNSGAIATLTAIEEYVRDKL